MTKLSVGNQTFNLNEKQGLAENAIASFKYAKLDGTARSFDNVNIKSVKITADNNVVILITENNEFKSMRLDRIISPMVSFETVITK